MSMDIIPGITPPPGASVIGMNGLAPVIPPAGAFKELTDRLGTPLSGAVSIKARYAFRTLYQSGLLNTLDVFGGGLMSEADSLLNWLSGPYAAVKGGDPSWTSADGFLFDGVEDYLDTGFNPSVEAGHYALNGASISLLVTDAGANDDYAMGTTTVSGEYARIGARAGQNNSRLNSATDLAINVASAAATGVWTLNRTGANTLRVLRNGALVAQATNNASSQMPAASIAIARSVTAYANRKIKGWAIGGALSATQEVALAAALGALK